MWWLIFYLIGTSSFAGLNIELRERQKDYAKGLPQVPLQHVKRLFIESEYVTGDAFRKLSRHVFDETDASFDPKSVQYGDTVFVNGDFLDLFFKYLHEKIAAPYVLITHNSDFSLPGKFSNYLDHNKIIAWFTVNPSTVHEKLYSIPIGFRNHHWDKSRDFVIDKVCAETSMRTNTLIMNFRVWTNSAERAPVFDFFRNADFCYFPGERNFEDFLRDMHHSKYCLSPFGNGRDCHRVYEALAVGCVPIVLSSVMDQIYVTMPILIVNDWTSINEERLNAHYEQIVSKVGDKSYLKTNYWKEKIARFGNLSC